ncbi:MAG: peptidyl-prolyl cis-trans isomerase [Nitrospinae bacterium]|nr:peptidyl-prolyl cis-trans isomerase [Nitrospinota bacterium]
MGCKGKSDGIKEEKDEIVALINGKEILLSDINRGVKKLTKRYGLYKSIEEERLKELRMSVLNELIEKTILFQEAERKDISVTDSEVNSMIEEITDDYPEGRLKEKLRDEKISLYEWKEKIKERVLIKKLITEEVNKGIEISDEEMREYYKANSDKYLQPVQVRVLQIVVKTETEAEEIYQRLIRGDNFARIAGERSITPEGKSDGDLGFFNKEEMPEEFDVVFNLEVGEISKVIQTPYGFHIFKVIERKEARKMDFDEARDIIKRKLLKERQDDRFKEWLKELKVRSRIMINDKILS